MAVRLSLATETVRLTLAAAITHGVTFGAATPRPAPFARAEKRPRFASARRPKPLGGRNVVAAEPSVGLPRKPVLEPR